jgi:DNA-binding NtrC family response regulator
MPNILIIDDERSIRKTLTEILTYEGYKVDEAGDGEEGLKKFRDKGFDAVLCDIKMPKVDGLEFLEKAAEINPDVPVIMISGHGTIETAVEAVKKGAYDYIAKPPDLNRLLITLRNAIERTSLVADVKVLRRKAMRTEEMIGGSQGIIKIKETIDKVAPTDARVLITGENGSGKELVARWLHEKSMRAKAPLVEVNCAAIPENLLESELFGHEKGAFTGATAQRIGRFEQCDKGTLFLDEIGEMPLQVQSKLLRVLQEGEFSRVGGNETLHTDVRIICATNRNLEEEVSKRTFRDDLFYRLNVVRIHIPPLRQRVEDIRLLAEYFLQKIANRSHTPPLKLSEEAVRVLENHPWPGNVRELENTLQRAAVLSTADTLLPKDIPLGASDSDSSRHGGPNEDSREMNMSQAIEVLFAAAASNSSLAILPWIEREFTLRAMQKTGENQVRAAKLLGITRATLRKRLDRNSSSLDDDE